MRDVPYSSILHLHKYFSKTVYGASSIALQIRIGILGKQCPEMLRSVRSGNGTDTHLVSSAFAMKTAISQSSPAVWLVVKDIANQSMRNRKSSLSQENVRCSCHGCVALKIFVFKPQQKPTFFRLRGTNKFISIFYIN